MPPIAGYKWVESGEKPIIPYCPHCTYPVVHLTVVPDRSPSYLRRILFCDNCKWVMPS